MKKIQTLFAIGLLVLCSFNYLFGQKKSGNRIAIMSSAIILKINGENGKVTGAEIFKHNNYRGVAKNLNKIKPAGKNDVLRIKVLDASENVLYDGYFENPLTQNLESFEENGAVNNNKIPGNSGYLNIRFPLSSSTADLSIKCYSIKNNAEEILVSTLNYKVR